MPSHLRLQSSPATPVAAHAIYNHHHHQQQQHHQTSPALPPAKKQKMSLTQTYYVASTARSKLGREARRGDHDLRLLVGHANLLDSLMAELANAEREQEAWFNQSVRTASKSEESRRTQWIEPIDEETEEEEDEREHENVGDSDSDLSSSDDEGQEDDGLFNIPIRKPTDSSSRSRHTIVSSAELFPGSDSDMTDSEDEDEDEDDEGEEYDAEHALARTISNSNDSGRGRSRVQHSPPELMYDSDSDSEDYDEDESQPPSPRNTPLELMDDKQRQAVIYKMDARQRRHRQQPHQQRQAGLEEYAMQQASRAPAVTACC